MQHVSRKSHHNRNNDLSGSRLPKPWAVVAVLTVAYMLLGCGGGGDRR